MSDCISYAKTFYDLKNSLLLYMSTYQLILICIDMKRCTKSCEPVIALNILRYLIYLEISCIGPNIFIFLHVLN